MVRFFTRERFGRPQFLAGLLLMVFLAQCGWLVSHSARHTEDSEVFRVDEGLRQWRGNGIAGTDFRHAAALSDSINYLQGVSFDSNDGYDANHSPMWYLIASAPIAAWPVPEPELSGYWGWLARVPYVIFGVLLGGSLWYVARRLYGNAGGYIALVLYCFSPAILRSSAIWVAQPEIGAAWGAFGAVFTAIAVAHTLYAPREVVLWNWRRIVLLGLSIALAVGSQFSLILLVPMALAFMLYLAPTRRVAAVAIWGAACGLAFVLLLSSYFFSPGSFWSGMLHADFLAMTGHAFGMVGAYQRVASQIMESSPVLVVALPVALVTFVLWRRARYFGNTAPLLVAALFLALSVGMPHYPGMGFALMAVPFLFVFVAGIAADLLETRYRNLATACVVGLLSAYAVWNLMGLAKIRG